GRNILSPALRGRYWEAWIPEPDEKEMTLRAGWLLKKLLEGGGKAMVALALAGLGLLWPATAHAAATGGPTSHPVSWLPLLILGGMIINARSSSQNPDSQTPAQKSEHLDLLDQYLEKNKIPRENWPEIRQTVHRLWQILSGVATAIGRNQNVRFRIGEWWKTDLDNMVIDLPLKEIVERRDNLDALAGGAAHEGGHVFETLFPRLPSYRRLLEKSNHPMAVHALFNVLGDMIQEFNTSERWPGLAKYYRALHALYRPDLFSGTLDLPEELRSAKPEPDAKRSDVIKKMFPHEEYLDALRSYWMTRQFPASDDIKNSEVRQAVKATQEAVQELLKIKSHKMAPSELERIKLDFKRLKLIEKKILTHYLRLVQISADQIQKALKQQGSQGQGTSQNDKSNGQSPSMEMPGQNSDQGKTDKKARQIINDRSKEIEKQLCPTHNGHDHSRGEEHQDNSGPIPMDPDEWDTDNNTDQAKSGSGQPAPPSVPGGSTQTQPSRQPNPLPSGASAHGRSGPVKRLDAKRLLDQNRNVIEMSQAANAYQSHLSQIYHLIESLAGRLENIFTKNHRVTWDERLHASGPRVSIKKWIRSAARGWKNRDDFKVFQRKRLPTKRDYKFTLLIDVSASMNGERINNALDVIVLFIETLERLGIDCSILGFDNKVYPLKNFSDTPADPQKLSHEEKAAMVERLSMTEGGGTHDTEAIYTALKGDSNNGIAGLESQPGERRVLMVITDGEGNGDASKKMDEVLAGAAQQGIEVIGIGVGAGMAYVKKRYPRHVLESNMETVPDKVGDILEEEIEGGFAGGVSDEENPDLNSNQSLQLLSVGLPALLFALDRPLWALFTFGAILGMSLFNTGFEAVTKAMRALSQLDRNVRPNFVVTHFAPQPPQPAITPAPSAKNFLNPPSSWTTVIGDKKTKIYFTAFSPNGKKIATFNYFRSVVIWDIASRAKIMKLTLKRGNGVPRAIAFSPDGRRLAIAYQNRMVIVCDAETGELLQNYIDLDYSPTAIAYSPDGRRLAVSHTNGMIVIYDTLDKNRWTATLAGATIRFQTHKEVYSVAFSPDNKTLITTRDRGIINLWNVSNQKRIHQISEDTFSVFNSAFFSSDGTTILAAGDNGQTILYDASSYQKKAIINDPDFFVRFASFSPDGGK
ncbi:MAG: VWA domain-containing protein, partial [Elusimicrobiota bacterium]